MEALRHNPDADRLERIAAQCTQGDLAGAELALSEWVRSDHCPATAVVMLAALLARRGKHDHALATLRQAQRLGVADDRLVMVIHMIVLMQLDLTQSARKIALRLHDEHGQDDLVAQWLNLVDIVEAGNLPTVTTAQAEQLACELTISPGVIPTLVTAQSVDADPWAIALLRKALSTVVKNLRDADHHEMICRAQAQLALLANDTDDARRWAHRGLRHNPYNAQLALVLAKIEDDAMIGPNASDVLDRVAERYPGYPDVRAALIRRQFHEGRTDEAGHNLTLWLEAQPDHPMALKLQREIAA
ncbi:MAG: hypothetical protein GC164_14500 [Phycisphaera sp.]|nr:hypothetical protein [Phycisphaera sp.]